MKTLNRLPLLIIFLTLGMILTVHANREAMAEQAEQIELRLATYGSPESGMVSEGIIWYADELAKRTKGNVKIKIFWGGSIAKIMELPRAVKSGLADIAPVVAVYHPELFPYVFGSSQSTMVLARADLGDWNVPYRRLMEEFPEVRNVCEKQNQKMLAFWDYDRMGVISRKPVRNFEEAKGVKIRNSGEYVPRIFKAAGFSPMSVPATEAYDAVSRGMVDAIHASADTANKYRWYEACKYFTRIPIYGTAMVYFMSINLDTWKKLPMSVQNEMLRLGNELTDIKMPSISRKVREDFERNFKKAGGTFFVWPEDEQKEWKAKVTKSSMDYYVKKMEAKNIPRLKEIVYRFAELMDYQWR
ncbi:MAG TPA: TRAP transporter substrate-binding protein DctP [Desulfatiglandales bacterium]|nr:TRAP transporter substrate-binding protein DctP [Desulfatiglandales bacterium]